MNFAELMNKTARIDTTPKVISEEHDLDNINIDREQAEDNAAVASTNAAVDRLLDAQQPGGWDEYEYGVTEEQADRMRRTPAGRRALQQRAVNRLGVDNSTGKVALVVAQRPAWSRMGVLVDRTMTGREAIEFASLTGWELEKIRQQYTVALQDGSTVTRDANAWAIVRTDTGVELTKRPVGSGFTIIHNEDLAEMIDTVRAEGLEVVSAGALGKGERVFICAKIPEDVLVAEGDTQERYVLLINSHDGSGLCEAYFIVNRAECANTVNAGIASGRKVMAIRHTANANHRVEDLKRALTASVQTFDAFAEMSKTLAATELSVSPRQYFDDILDEAFAQTYIAGSRVTAAKMANGTIDNELDRIANDDARAEECQRYERHQTRRARLLQDMTDRFQNERCNGKESITGSVWAAVQAVTEHLDHSPLWQLNNENSKRDAKERREGRFNSLVNGRVAKLTEYAFELANGMVADRN